MRSLKFLLALVLLAAAPGAGVWAGGRTHIGIGMYFGPPTPPWYYYPPPYYYYPPRVVVVPATPPPVYIEQGVAAPPAPVAAVPPPPAPQMAVPAPQTEYWYYCRQAQAYYPYVRDCPGGWEQVPASMPPS